MADTTTDRSTSESHRRKTVRINPSGKVDSVPIPINAIEERDDGNVDIALAFLKESGLGGNATIDPVSLQALRDLCNAPSSKAHVQPVSQLSRLTGNKSYDSSATVVASESEQGIVQEDLPPMPHIQLNSVLLKRIPSDLTTNHHHPHHHNATTARGANSRTFSQMDEDDEEICTDATDLGSTKMGMIAGGSGGNHNKMIMEQLEMQTALLMDMQRQMDDLTAVVHHMNNNTNNNTNTNTTPSPFPFRRQEQPQDRGGGNALRVATPPLAPLHQAVRPPHAAAVVREVHNEMYILTLLTRLTNAVLHLPTTLRQSRIAEMMYVFRDLINRHVQLEGGGLLFKVVFMMAILSSRMPKNSGKGGKGMKETVQMYVIPVCILVGFLFQCGIMKVLHIYFWKEQYPARIWNGETIDLNAPPPAPPAVANNNNNNDNNIGNHNNNGDHDDGDDAAPGPDRQRGLRHFLEDHGDNDDGNFLNLPIYFWRNNFLGGRVPQAQQHPFLRGMQDIFLVFGSFILSILPMWKPEARPVEQPPEQEDVNTDNSGGGNDDDDGPPQAPRLIDENHNGER